MEICCRYLGCYYEFAYGRLENNVVEHVWYDQRLLVHAHILILPGVDIVIPLRSILTGLMYTKTLKINDSNEPAEDVSFP